MNGQIVVDVTMHGTPPFEEYRFDVRRPDGTTVEQTATVLNIVVRNLRQGPRHYAEVGNSLRWVSRLSPFRRIRKGDAS